MTRTSAAKSNPSSPPTLQEAYRERSTLLGYLKMDPRFDPLRNDSGFQELVRRIGLEP